MSDESSIYSNSWWKLIAAIWSTCCKIPKQRFLEVAILYVTLKSQNHTASHFRFSVTGYNLGGHINMASFSSNINMQIIDPAFCHCLQIQSPSSDRWTSLKYNLPLPHWWIFIRFHLQEHLCHFQLSFNFISHLDGLWKQHSGGKGGGLVSWRTNYSCWFFCFVCWPK